MPKELYNRGERYFIYVAMLALIRKIPVEPTNNPYPSEIKNMINFCYMFHKVVDQNHVPLYYLPELFDQKPMNVWKNNGAYWYHPCDRIRDQILVMVIKDMNMSKLEESYWRLRNLCRRKKRYVAN